MFRIVGENAIAAGVRRIEAVAGLEAYRKATDEVALIKSLAGKVNSPVHDGDSILGWRQARRQYSRAPSHRREEVTFING